jgi:hypothetical protein
VVGLARPAHDGDDLFDPRRVGRSPSTTKQTNTRLYLRQARSADLLEVVTIVRDDGSEVAIHAMKMRPDCPRLLPGG